MTESVLQNMGLKPHQARNNLEMWNLTQGSDIQIDTILAYDVLVKHVLNGHFCIDFHERCFKYDAEVVLSTWSYQKPVKGDRPVNDGYYRSETAMSPYEYFLTTGLATERLKLVYPEEYNAAMLQVDRVLMQKMRE